MFTAQAEGAGQPALRGWDTVTLWGELSANKGCATDLRVRRAPGRNQKREGEGPRELQGGRQTLPPSRADRPTPFCPALPSGGQSPDVCSPGSACLTTASARARCRQAGCGGGSSSAAIPPARRPNMVRAGLRGVCRLGAEGGRSLPSPFGGRGRGVTKGG